MASGYGLTGGTSRCFPFWQELLACYVINSNSEDNTGVKKCAPAMEDYYECLHHKKEAARTLAVQNAYRKAIQGHPRESQPNASQIRNLGLLGKDEESRAFLTEFQGKQNVPAKTALERVVGM